MIMYIGYSYVLLPTTVSIINILVLPTKGYMYATFNYEKRFICCELFTC